MRPKAYSNRRPQILAFGRNDRIKCLGLKLKPFVWLARKCHLNTLTRDSLALKNRYAHSMVGSKLWCEANDLSYCICAILCGLHPIFLFNLVRCSCEDSPLCFITTNSDLITDSDTLLSSLSLGVHSGHADVCSSEQVWPMGLLA